MCKDFRILSELKGLFFFWVGRLLDNTYIWSLNLWDCLYDVVAGDGDAAPWLLGESERTSRRCKCQVFVWFSTHPILCVHLPTSFVAFLVVVVQLGGIVYIRKVPF